MGKVKPMAMGKEKQSVPNNALRASHVRPCRATSRVASRNRVAAFRATLAEADALLGGCARYPFYKSGGLWRICGGVRFFAPKISRS